MYIKGHNIREFILRKNMCIKKRITKWNTLFYNEIENKKHHNFYRKWKRFSSLQNNNKCFWNTRNETSFTPIEDYLVLPVIPLKRRKRIKNPGVHHRSIPRRKRSDSRGGEISNHSRGAFNCNGRLKGSLFRSLASKTKINDSSTREKPLCAWRCPNQQQTRPSFPVSVSRSMLLDVAGDGRHFNARVDLFGYRFPLLAWCFRFGVKGWSILVLELICDERSNQEDVCWSDCWLSSLGEWPDKICLERQRVVENGARLCFVFISKTNLCKN